MVALSHLHFDHAGGLLTADGGRAFARARIVAQADEWEFALGTNPRLQASYEQADLRLVEPWGRAGSATGDEEVLPGVSVVRTGGHSGGHQVDRRARAVSDGWLLRRPVHASVERQSSLGDRRSTTSR